MNLKWFRKLTPAVRLFVLSGAILFFLSFYIPLAKYIKPAVTSLLLPPLKLCRDISSNAVTFLSFQNLLEETKRLGAKVDELTAQSVQLQEVLSENERLRSLLSLPQRKTWQTYGVQKPQDLR